MRPIIIILAIILSGCSVSNDVVQQGWIQKRKYRPGFHLNIQRPSATSDLSKQWSNRAVEKLPVVASPSFGYAHQEEMPSAAKKAVSMRPDIKPQDVTLVKSEPTIRFKHSRKWHIPNSPRINRSLAPQEEEKEDQKMVGRALLALGALIAFTLPFLLIDIVTFPILPMIGIGILLAFILLYLAVLPDLETKKGKVLGILGVLKVFLPAIIIVLLFGSMLWFFASMFAF